jgi:hypothetical protein
MKRVLVPAVTGMVVMILWLLIVNGLFGFRRHLEMKRVPNESYVYAVLAVNITEPGQYIANPDPLPDGSPDEDAAVYGILYSGIGHRQAGTMLLAQLTIVFAPLLATWLLSLMPDVLLRSLARKVLVFTTIGLVIALYVRLQEFGIAARTPGDALRLAIHDVVLWTVMGVAVGWKLQHRSARG